MIDYYVKSITMCCRKLHNFCRWICWLIYRCCCCRCPRKYVYLLDPENGRSTKAFANEFRYFVDWSIEFECVQSLSCCHKDYPIALLLRRVTDRARENINSKLKSIPEDLYKRTALICIHVVSKTWFLPNVSTAQKVSEFKELGIILDFGLIDQNIYPCVYKGKKNSKQAFEDFVKDRTSQVQNVLS